MKKSALLISILALFSSFTSKAQEKKAPAIEDFYALSFNTISGEKFDFSQLKGKKVLIVNTASKCGFTPQFKDLEELHKKFGSQLIILGFPSNDFLNQDPGTNSEIQSFCELNYGVTFQMMEKSSVKGKDKNPVYQWLTQPSKNGWCKSEPSWNFNKYLIDENGNLLEHFGSKVKPLSEEIISLL